jgi:hypothetical protein
VYEIEADFKMKVEQQFDAMVAEAISGKKIGGKKMKAS